MDNRNKLIIGGVGAVVLISVVLIVASFDSIEPREYGILYNSIDKTIDQENIYLGGTSFVGLFNSFIAFPSGYQKIEFSDNPSAKNEPLNARTSDGVSIGLSLSLQYQLIKDEVALLYNQFNTNYESTFSSIARDIIMQITANYQAKQFWEARTIISQTMLSELNNALVKDHATCVLLQLLTVTIPSNLEKSIVDTQVEKQLSSTKIFERQAELIRQTIDISISQCDQNITTITAAANAEAYYVVQVAEAVAKRRNIDIQSIIYEKIRSNLTFTDDEFTSYLFLAATADQKNATICVGLTDAVIQIKTY